MTETFFESNEVMLAQIQAGGAAYDLIVPSDYMVSIMAEEGLLIPLDKAAIPNLANLDPKFTGLPFDPDGDYSAALPVGHHRHRLRLRGRSVRTSSRRGP